MIVIIATIVIIIMMLKANFQNGFSGGPNAAQWATTDDAAGRAHQRHDRHVRSRGDGGNFADSPMEIS